MRSARFSEDDEAVQDVEVHLEESVTRSFASTGSPLDESGFADFAVAGTQGSGEFRCADCGYGAIVQHALPPCPMCGGTIWESREPRLSPFAR